MIARDQGNLLKACVSICLFSACVPARARLTNSAAGHICQTQIPCISVLVINTARVPENTLSVALDKAGLIFRGAGVRVTWVGRPGGSLPQATFPDSTLHSANILVLRIISRPIGEFATPDALGFAFVTGGDSKYASVFGDRICAATRGGRYSEGMLMGHAIAHELGHLLLGTSAHSHYGLMAARWGTNELDRAEVGFLQFSPAEAARLRSTICEFRGGGGCAIASGVNAGGTPILVLVHNYAHVDTTVLRRAEKSAARVLATAEVEVHWVDSTESSQAPKQYQSPPDPLVLILQLLPPGATRGTIRLARLGGSTQTGHFGFFAGVFCDRVERLSSDRFSEPVILGHIIAHEIGHLLLGIRGHTDSGIMKAEWHRKELEQAVNETLVFDPAQRRRITQNLKVRSSSALGVQSARAK